MNLTTWVWVTAAAILLVAEVLSPSLFLLPFALGAGCAAVACAMGASPGWQWIAFVAVSSVLTIVLHRARARRTKR